MQMVQSEWCHTFSIVARDPDTGALGVAVQSKAFSVGSLVPWVRGGIGAIATQAYTDPRYGAEGLCELAQRRDPEPLLAEMLDADENRDVRQVAMIDASGRIAVHTGSGCPEHAAHYVGDGFACQGNLLVSTDVVSAMASAFQEAKAPLEKRLLAALRAGQRQGGDRRGQQSAALVVHRSDRDSYARRERIDLRVDDHPRPIEEIARLLELYDLYLAESTGRKERAVPIDESVILRIQRALHSLELYSDTIHGRMDAATTDALDRFLWQENLAGVLDIGNAIDARVLCHLERLASRAAE